MLVGDLSMVIYSLFSVVLSIGWVRNIPWSLFPLYRLSTYHIYKDTIYLWILYSKLNFELSSKVNRFNSIMWYGVSSRMSCRLCSRVHFDYMVIKNGCDSWISYFWKIMQPFMQAKSILMSSTIFLRHGRGWEIDARKVDTLSNVTHVLIKLVSIEKF